MKWFQKIQTLIGLQRTIPPGIVFSLRTLATILALDAALEGAGQGRTGIFDLNARAPSPGVFGP